MSRGGEVDHRANGFDPHAILRDFDRGATSRTADGRTLREWTLIASEHEIEIAPGVRFTAWSYNGRIPGPTLRATEGDRLRTTFINGTRHPHTIHFHGIHPATMDGVAGIGDGDIAPGGRTVYEFDAALYGLQLYHCHVRPLAEHIAKGLYGTLIIDPKQPRQGRRDGHGDERLRRELRPRQRALRGEHDRLRLRRQAHPGHARRARPAVPRQHPRVRPGSTRFTCTATSSTTSRPGRRGPAANSRTRRRDPDRARDALAARIRRIPPSWLRVVMALTVRLLAFLAIDATLEGVELAGEGSQAFGGVARGAHARDRTARKRLMGEKSAMATAHGTGQSNAIEDYAKSIYSLQQRAAGAAVTTNALAERCGVTPARRRRWSRSSPSAGWRFTSPTTVCA